MPSIARWLGRLTELIFGLLPMPVPRYAKACEDRKLYPAEGLLRLDDPVAKALGFVKGVTGSFDSPDMSVVLKEFDSERESSGEDPWGRKWQQTRRVLRIWEKQLRPVSSFKLLIIRITNPVAWYRPSAETALERYREGTRLHRTPYLSEGVRQAVSCGLENTDRSGVPRWDIALREYRAWHARNDSTEEFFGSKETRAIEANLARWQRGGYHVNPLRTAFSLALVGLIIVMLVGIWFGEAMAGLVSSKAEPSSRRPRVVYWGVDFVLVPMVVGIIELIDWLILQVARLWRATARLGKNASPRNPVSPG